MPIDRHASLAELATAMDGGQVEVLVILGGNPVFTAPADLKFAERLSKVGLVAYLGHPRRRNRASRSLEPPGGACARELGGRARVRRHRDADAAAGRAALRGTLGARSAGAVHRAGGSPRHADRQGLLDARIRRRRRLEHPRRQRAGVQGRRHVLAPRRPRRLHRRHRGDRRRPGTPFTPAPVVAPPKPAPGTPRRTRAPSPTCAAVAPTPHSAAGYGGQAPVSRLASSAQPRAPSPEPRSPRLRAVWRSSSAPIRRSGTAASRTTAGCRSCPSR